MIHRSLIALLICAVPVAARADADRDWKAVLALDSGPKQKPASSEQAALLARNHFLIQKQALGNFTTAYPRDRRAPEARLRLAEIVAAEGMMDRDRRQVTRALGLFDAVADDPGAPPPVRADAAFRRASIFMQTIPGGPEKNATAVAEAATGFADRHPGDPRAARLLVEAATVCDALPATKRSLLLRANEATREESLRLRISDDLSRLDRLGKPLELKMPALDGAAIDIASLRGKPTLIVFWASHSPQSLLWLRDFHQQWTNLPKDSLNVVTINMDENRNEARQRAKSLPSAWPVAWEPGGWKAPTARSLGINALPTVWFLDARGNLQSLAAKSTWKTHL